jgi:ParB family chromosome partitioning protein
MTAPAATEISELGLEFLFPSPENARKSFDPDQMRELADSIHGQGILTPLIVRNLESPEGWNGGPRWEIVAGHRRHQAAKLAGLKTAPCIIRNLTDHGARELGIIDNLQREDVGALEEAEAFGALYDVHGSIPDVAARVSKDVAYVAKRLRLRSLTLAGQDALRERLITVDHALLLARLGGEEQDAALKWALDHTAGSRTGVEAVLAERMELRKKQEDGSGHWRWEPQSAQRLKEHIEQESGRKLSRAPWSLDDDTLIPEAAACNACPSNTKANTALFSDLAIEEATCADGCCFEAKREEYVLRRIEASRAGDGTPRIATLSWKSSSVKPATCFNDVQNPGYMTGTANPAKVLRQGQWVEAKKGSCPNVRTGITVDWSDDGSRGYTGSGEKLRKPGEALPVCIAVGCKVHPKAYEEQKSAGAGHAKRDEAAEKAAQEKRKSEAIEESKLRLAVAAKAIEGITGIPEAALRFIVLAALPDWEEARKPFTALMPGLLKTLREAKLESVEFAQGIAVASLSRHFLTAGEWNGPNEGRKEFLAEIKRLGYDGSSAWAKPAKKAPAKPAKKAAAKPAKKASAKPAKKAPAKKTGKLSPETRKRIAGAVKKRWANSKAAGMKPISEDDDPEGGDT